MTPPPAHDDPPAWPKVRRRTGWLLLAWLGLVLLPPLLLRGRGGSFFGWPLDYWLHSQGMLLLFVGLVIAIVLAIEHAERTSDAQPDAQAGPQDSPDARPPGPG